MYYPTERAQVLEKFEDELGLLPEQLQPCPDEPIGNAKKLPRRTRHAKSFLSGSLSARRVKIHVAEMVPEAEEHSRDQVLTAAQYAAELLIDIEDISPATDLGR